MLLALGLATVLTYGAERVIDDWINVTGEVLVVVYDTLTLVRYGLFAWLAATLIMQSADMTATARGLDERSPDRHLVRFVARLAALAVISVLIVLVAQELGLPVYSVVTGLGIGGLAVAFAAQQSLGAVFGSIMIVMDRPFRVGDHLYLDGREGVVEDIGFRSTRVRTESGSVLTIPNSEMASATVDNLGQTGRRSVRAEFEIRDDTPPEAIRAFLDRLRAILADSPALVPGDSDVVLTGFGAAGLAILLECVVDAPDRRARRRAIEALHMRILDAAAELGVAFAPSQALDIALSEPSAPAPGAQASER
jgi:MscS family membrane protein